MKTYNNLYEKICSMNNLANSWRRARKKKTKKIYVVEFEKDTRGNLLRLKEELLNQTYNPEPMKTFILRDPKTRKISKSAFRDRIVHHSVVGAIEPIFERIFIYDCCANRIRKGNLFALKRLKYFINKISENGDCLRNRFNDKNFIFGYCLKADIKHYFQEVNRNILLNIIRKKISCEKTINLIKLILNNFEGEKGMPLGNLTSQFFANVYLNELDYFVKHKLRAKCYIRYVDDFILLHKSKHQLEIWKEEIRKFLKQELNLELHPDKSQIVPLSRGLDFVGFRNFYHFKLLRKRNTDKIKRKIDLFNKRELSHEKLFDSFQGWNAYSKWSNNYYLNKELTNKIIFYSP
jgi:hypothetical protein